MSITQKVNNEDTHGITHFANNIDKGCIFLTKLLREVESHTSNLTEVLKNMKVVLDEYRKQHADAKLSVMARRAYSGLSPFDNDDEDEDKKPSTPLVKAEDFMDLSQRSEVNLRLEIQFIIDLDLSNIFLHS